MPSASPVYSARPTIGIIPIGGDSDNFVANLWVMHCSKEGIFHPADEGGVKGVKSGWVRSNYPLAPITDVPIKISHQKASLRAG